MNQYKGTLLEVRYGLTKNVLAILALAALMIFSAVPHTAAPSNSNFNILVYSSDEGLAAANRYPVVALDNLGMPYTYVVKDKVAFLGNLTSQSWDLVVIDEPSWVNDAWTDLKTYVVGGGRLIYSTWDMFDIPSDPLWAALGVVYISYFSNPVDVYQWDTSHPIFNTPNHLANPIDNFTNDWSVDGEIVGVVGDGVAIGGNTSSPSGGAMLVVANGGKTVFNGFLFAELDNDFNSNGKTDAVELIENEIMFVLGLSVVSPVGGIVLPTNTFALMAPWMALTVAAVTLGAVVFSRRKTFLH